MHANSLSLLQRQARPNSSCSGATRTPPCERACGTPTHVFWRGQDASIMAVQHRAHVRDARGRPSAIERPSHVLQGLLGCCAILLAGSRPCGGRQVRRSG